MLTVYPVCVFISIALIRESSAPVIAAVSAVVMLALGIMGIRGIIATSDVIVSDEAVSRAMLGRTWQRIRWNEIERVRMTRDSQVAIYNSPLGVEILPTRHTRARWPLSGSLSFSGGQVDLRPLVTAINRYIQMYGIKTEQTIGGITTTVDTNHTFDQLNGTKSDVEQVSNVRQFMNGCLIVAVFVAALSVIRLYVVNHEIVVPPRAAQAFVFVVLLAALRLGFGGLFRSVMARRDARKRGRSP